MRHSIVRIVGALERVRIPLRKKTQDWRGGSVVHTLGQVITSLAFAKATLALSNRELADTTHDIPPKVRRKLGLGTPFSSSFVFTSLRDMLTTGWNGLLATQYLKALQLCPPVPPLVPGGLMILDGKKLGGAEGEPPNGSCQHTVDHLGNRYWYNSVLRAVHVVGTFVLCAGQYVIPAGQGESTAFRAYLDQLIALLGKQFPRCLSLDAGLASIANLQLIRTRKLHYIAEIKRNHRKLLARMEHAFSTMKTVAAETMDDVNGKLIWRRLFRMAAPAGLPAMPDNQQWWMVEHTITNKSTAETNYERHYYVTSLAWKDVGARGILRAVRLHWMVENGSNWTADVIFHEDKHQPCTKGNGVINNGWLWMLAINLVTLVRMLLSTKDRKVAWKHTAMRIRDALMDEAAWDGRKSQTPA